MPKGGLNGASLPADRVLHLVANIAEFLNRDVFQAFTASVEVFVDFQGRFLHHRMRILTPTPKEEVFTLRDARLIVVFVEAQAEQRR
jgi:hypothetical protein